MKNSSSSSAGAALNVAHCPGYPSTTSTARSGPLVNWNGVTVSASIAAKLPRDCFKFSASSATAEKADPRLRHSTTAAMISTLCLRSATPTKATCPLKRPTSPAKTRLSDFLGISDFELKLLHILRERPHSRADLVAAIIDRSEPIIAGCLRTLKNKKLIRIRYNPVCVYSLTNDGYIVCEHYQGTTHQD